MTLYYSDLEVVPQRNLTEFVPEANLPEVAPETNLPEPTQPDKIYYEDAPKELVMANIEAPPPQRRICGLPPKRFWLLLCAIILIVAGAAIGGGLGAAQVIKSKSDSSDKATPGKESSSGNQSSTGKESTTAKETVTSKGTGSSSPPTATATTKGPATLTTSLQIGPTQTLYRDCPSSNYTIYNALGSSDYQFRKFCNAGLRWSGGDVVHAPAASLNDCINMCVAYNVENKTAIANRKSSVCNGVCWRNSIKDPDWPGQCFGSTFQNSSVTGFPMTEETICDSAAWINQNFP